MGWFASKVGCLEAYDLVLLCSGLDALAPESARFVRKKEEKPKKRRVISRGVFLAVQLRRR